jgi:hypothetical protein
MELSQLESDWLLVHHLGGDISSVFLCPALELDNKTDKSILSKRLFLKISDCFFIFNTKIYIK